ncbi:LysE family transporter [Humisphaera borealis]|uniref:LysE family transporter n=1 Tax=Humisphaera borealis TaxID=2807512 RepID=A0A7M2WPY1_9BACT|nr:LysE family transporter [Humisphaera borealis]QOV87528.1 LysE family transporter [Humisphaera borealis]
MDEIVADLLMIAAVSVGWQALARGMALGLGAAIPIGPVNVEIARRVLRHGFLAGAALGLGAVTVDVFYAVLSTFSFARLLNQPAVLLTMSGLGTLLLGYLGVQCLIAARKAWTTDPIDASLSDTAAASRSGHTALRSYVTGLLMTLLNPMTLAFWFVVVPAMGTGQTPAAGDSAGQTTSQAAGSQLPMMCVGVFLGTVGWVLGFSTALSIAQRAAGSGHRRRKWLALADAIGGAALLGFGVLSAVGFWQWMKAVL